MEYEPRTTAIVHTWTVQQPQSTPPSEHHVFLKTLWLMRQSRLSDFPGDEWWIHSQYVPPPEQIEQETRRERTQLLATTHLKVHVKSLAQRTTSKIIFLAQRAVSLTNSSHNKRQRATMCIPVHQLHALAPTTLRAQSADIKGKISWNLQQGMQSRSFLIWRLIFHKVQLSVFNNFSHNYLPVSPVVLWPPAPDNNCKQPNSTTSWP